jgi:hypothetical protein
MTGTEGAGGRRYPSYVACAKDDFVRFYVEEELHCECELDGISAGFSDDSWGQLVIVDEYLLVCRSCLKCRVNTIHQYSSSPRMQQKYFRLFGPCQLIPPNCNPSETCSAIPLCTVSAGIQRPSLVYGKKSGSLHPPVLVSIREPGQDVRLYGMTPLGSIPQLAVRTTFAFESSIRFANSAEANPPNTTEWIAPILAHASIP